MIDTRRAAFAHHAQRGERVVCIDGGSAVEPLPCSGCGRSLEPPLAFAPEHIELPRVPARGGARGGGARVPWPAEVWM